MAITELMTTGRAARRCGLSPRSLERWRSLGKGPPFIGLEGAVRYDVADLEKSIARGRRGAETERGSGPR